MGPSPRARQLRNPAADAARFRTRALVGFVAVPGQARLAAATGRDDLWDRAQSFADELADECRAEADRVRAWTAGELERLRS